MSAAARAKTRDEVAEAYKSPPWWYDARGFLILTFAYNSTLGTQLRFFGANMGTRHLEVACGTGTLLQMVLGWRKRRAMPPTYVTGIDYAESMLAGARRRFAKHPEVELRHADATQLPYEGAAFDTASIANAVHCLPDLDAALRDVWRVLAPGGTLAANVLLFPRGPWPFRGIAERINRWGMRKGILHTPYQLDDIRRRMLDAGYEIASERISGNCVNILARKPTR